PCRIILSGQRLELLRVLARALLEAALDEAEKLLVAIVLELAAPARVRLRRRRRRGGRLLFRLLLLSRLQPFCGLLDLVLDARQLATAEVEIRLRLGEVELVEGALVVLH